MYSAQTIEDFNDLRSHYNDLLQQMLDELNDGESSAVLRYLFFKEALKHHQADPIDFDEHLNIMVESYLKSRMECARSTVTVTTITI